MKRLGIEPPRVNILDEKSELSTDDNNTLPGNNINYEKFDRDDRYGTFGGDKMWDKVVDFYYDDPSYKRPEVQNKQFHIEPYNERFDNLDHQILSLKGLNEAYNQGLQDDLRVEDYEAPYTSDHLKYEQKSNAPKPERKMIYSKEANQGQKDLPGIINSQKRIDQVKKMQIERRISSAILIQRMYRGFKARQLFKKLVQKKNIQDEEDYGYFEITGMGVKDFLDKRKQKIEDEKIRKQAISDLSPGQKIEQNRFLMHDLQSHNDDLNMLDIYFNKMNGKNPFETPERSFVTMPETPTKSKSKKRQKAIKNYNQEQALDSYSGSIQESIKQERSNSRFSNKDKKERRTAPDADDYSDDFETDSIRESIRESISGSFKDKRGSGIYDSGKKTKFYENSKRSVKPYQSDDEISESIHGDRTQKSLKSIKESIDEEIPEDSLIHRGSFEGSNLMSSRKNKQRSPNIVHSDSIKEEISGSGRFSPRIKDSIPEEIDGSQDYSQNFDSVSQSKDKLSGSMGKKKEFKNRIPEQVPKREYVYETKQDIELRKRLEKKYGINRPDTTEDLIFEFINAKKVYEQSTTTMH